MQEIDYLQVLNDEIAGKDAKPFAQQRRPGRPVYAIVGDSPRREAILNLALYNYTTPGLASFHHWEFSVSVAIGYVEKLEAMIAAAESERATTDPVNQRTVYERVP